MSIDSKVEQAFQSDDDAKVRVCIFATFTRCAVFLALLGFCALYLSSYFNTVLDQKDSLLPGWLGCTIVFIAMVEEMLMPGISRPIAEPTAWSKIYTFLVFVLGAALSCALLCYDLGIAPGVMLRAALLLAVGILVFGCAIIMMHISRGADKFLDFMEKGA